eukprot:GEMP01064676.1.p1 GENE.GEMP01064676.1~~GEMP01064676.1.p1  ORF type:complete len:342 (+),score=63.78 GEMP01064676.1:210-1235(+)
MMFQWLDVSLGDCLCPTNCIVEPILPGDILQDSTTSPACRIHRIDSFELCLIENSPVRRTSVSSYRESVSYRETIVEDDFVTYGGINRQSTAALDGITLLDRGQRGDAAERFHVGNSFRYARADTVDSVARAPSFNQSKFSTVSSSDEVVRPLARTNISFDMSLGKLGLDVGRFRDFLLIVEIKPNCLVEEFNIKEAILHDVQYGIVEVGDQILSVNGEKKPRNMLLQLNRAAQEKGKVAIRVRKRKKRFTVEIRPPRRKKGLLKLGIQCEVASDTVKIISMKKGLITDWCQDHATSNVCVGDWIQEVNGCVGAEIITAMEDWIIDPAGPLRIAIVVAEDA